MIRLLVALCVALALGGCAQHRVAIEGKGLPPRIELTEVPFFPQQDYQCGPAALATMLAQRNIAVTPDDLVGQVYLPSRKGSLQVELVAASRAAGLLVYPLQPRLETVLTEVAAGNPVLVLQNLAFDRWPQWHFAVVVGYDLAQQQIILRSGTTRRWVGSFAQFERSWAKGGRWAILTLPPSRLPATAQELRWLQAASDLEQTQGVQQASVAYRTAVERWGSALSWFALGNSQYAGRQFGEAERAFRQAIIADGHFAPAWNNLAQLLAERGCTAGAAVARRCASQVGAQSGDVEASSRPAHACGAPPRCP